MVENQTCGSALAPSPFDIDAEDMKNAVLTRLLAERYSFPRWFSQPRPDMSDTETQQARRRRQMAADFESLRVEETA